MSKKTTIIFQPDGLIKDIKLGVGMLEALQDLLLFYLSNCENEQEIRDTYKKINLVSKGHQVEFKGAQSHIYVLVALIQNLRMLALEQGVAKEVEIEDAVHVKAKEIVNLFMMRDENNNDAIKSKFNELKELTKDFTSD